MSSNQGRRASPAAFKWSSASLGALIVALGGGAMAHAQSTAEPASGDRAVDIGEIVVTASRVARDGYAAPTPTTTVGDAEIKAAGPANLADYINQLPVLSGSSTPRTSNGSVAGGTGGANFLNLRSLGIGRTLVLLDGHRVASAALNGGVDINLLPTALVQQIDVVTGGASAAWGSDAVAGVVNFSLDKTFTGFKGDVQLGQSEQGDAKQHKIELSYGQHFAGDRGHFMITGQYGGSGGVNRADSRDWYKGNRIINNPAYVAGNGQPQRIIASNVGVATATEDGLIVSGPLANLQFGANGTTSTFDPGYVSGLIKLGGTPNDWGRQVQLQNPLKQGSVFTRVSYDLTNRLSAYGEFSYGQSVSDYDSVPYFRFGNITIQNDNAYLPAAVKAQMTTLGLTSFAMGRITDDIGIAKPHNDRKQLRFLSGLKGSFGDGWTWDAYYQHGQSKIVNEVSNNVIVSRFNLATDAVLSGSNIVCRSTLAASTNGCVPLNLFGAGSPSDAAKAYILGTATQNITIKQDVASASVQGEPLSVWAGPVSIAAGAEYRKEQYEADADAISQASGFWVGNYKASTGQYDVKEGFVETVVPLLAGAPFVKKLDFNGAVRITDYSTSGTVKTWKAGLTYEVNDYVRFRATRSRDIRAPNFNELFQAGTVQSSSVNDPQKGNVSYAILVTTKGNPDAQPEVADTKAFGVVLSTPWIPGLSASVDYYRISIQDALLSLTQQQIVDRCAAGATELCSFITRDGTGVITQIVTTSVNAQSENTEGLDIDVSYRLPLSRLREDWDANLTLRALGSYVNYRKIDTGSGVHDYAGELSSGSISLSEPNWRWQMSATYAQGPASITLRSRYIGAGVLNSSWKSGVDIDNNDVKSTTYLDLSGAYDFSAFGSNSQVYFVVDNLLDQDPRVVPGIGNNAYGNVGTNTSIYDVVGRSFRVGWRFSF